MDGLNAIIEASSDDAICDVELSGVDSVTGQMIGNEKPKHEVTFDVVDAVCSEQAANINNSEAKRLFFKNVDRVQVTKVLGFMNTCLCPASRLLHTAREKAWTAYNKEYLAHRDSVTELTGSACLGVILCIKIFEKMLALNFPVHPSPNLLHHSRDLTDQDFDIIYYIGGSIIKKQKQKLLRLSDSEAKTKLLKCLDCMCRKGGSPDVEEQTLTNVRDRGGLVYLTDNAKNMFTFLEMKFRDNTENVTDNQFEEMCRADFEIMSKFEECVYNIGDTEDGKIMSFSVIVKHFFRIRIHHECTLFMDKYRCAEAKSKKEKGLRKKLKKSTTSLLK